MNQSKTEIKFYHNAPDRLMAAASIAAKAVKQGLRVLVHAPNAAIAQRFDAMLWSAQTHSFVPHVAANSPLAARTPIIIASGLDNLPEDARMRDVLLNLDDQAPRSFERFKILVEIVSTSEADRQLARQRWQAFKELGHPITAYDLAKKI